MIGLLIPHAEQPSELVRALTWAPLSAVYTSPVDRAVETAQPLANDHGFDARVRNALTDAAGSEALADVQRRVVSELMALAKSHPDETIAIVTHADPIRCALAAFGDTALEDMREMEISPSHVSAIGITASGVRRVLGVNVPAVDMAV